jgi:hypothetical protein
VKIHLATVRNSFSENFHKSGSGRATVNYWVNESENRPSFDNCGGGIILIAREKFAFLRLPSWNLSFEKKTSTHLEIIDRVDLKGRYFYGKPRKAKRYRKKCHYFCPSSFLVDAFALTSLSHVSLTERFQSKKAVRLSLCDNFAKCATSFSHSTIPHLQKKNKKPSASIN